MARTFEELSEALKAAGMSNAVLLAVAKTNPAAIEALLPEVGKAQAALTREAVTVPFEELLVARNAFSGVLGNVAEDIKAGRTLGDAQSTALDNSLTELSGKVRALRAVIGGKKAAASTGNGASGPKRRPEEVVANLTDEQKLARDRENIYHGMSARLQKHHEVGTLAEAYAKNPSLPKNVWTHAAYEGLDIPEASRALFEAWCRADKKTNDAWAAGQTARKAQAAS